jgi:hypothetical protein
MKFAGVNHNKPLELILEDNPQAESELGATYHKKPRKNPTKKYSDSRMGSKIFKEEDEILQSTPTKRLETNDDLTTIKQTSIVTIDDASP